LLVGGFQRDVTGGAVAAEAGEVVRPAEEFVPERAGVIDDRGPGDEPGVGERQAGLGEGHEPAVEECERSVHADRASAPWHGSWNGTTSSGRGCGKKCVRPCIWTSRTCWWLTIRALPGLAIGTRVSIQSRASRGGMPRAIR